MSASGPAARSLHPAGEGGGASFRRRWLHRRCNVATLRIVADEPRQWLAACLPARERMGGKA